MPAGNRESLECGSCPEELIPGGLRVPKVPADLAGTGAIMPAGMCGFAPSTVCADAERPLPAGLRGAAIPTVCAGKAMPAGTRLSGTVCKGTGGAMPAGSRLKGASVSRAGTRPALPPASLSPGSLGLWPAGPGDRSAEGRLDTSATPSSSLQSGMTSSVLGAEREASSTAPFKWKTRGHTFDLEVRHGAFECSHAG